LKELENFIPVARLFGKEGESQIIYAANEVSVKKAINCIGKDVLKEKKKKKKIRLRSISSILPHT